MPLAQLEKAGHPDTLRKLNGDKLLAARLLGIGKDHALPQAEGVRHQCSGRRRPRQLNPAPVGAPTFHSS